MPKASSRPKTAADTAALRPTVRIPNIATYTTIVQSMKEGIQNGGEQAKQKEKLAEPAKVVHVEFDVESNSKLNIDEAAEQSLEETVSKGQAIQSLSVDLSATPLALGPQPLMDLQ